MSLSIDSSLDKNGMNFLNGYYNVQKNEFKSGVNCSTNLQINYEYKEFDEHDPEITQLKQILYESFVDKNIYQWTINFAASLCRNAQPEDPILIIRGPGASGKSTWLELLQATFGSYMKIATPNLLTETIEYDQIYDQKEADHLIQLPQLMDTKIVVISECSQDSEERILLENLKIMTSTKPLQDHIGSSNMQVTWRVILTGFTPAQPKINYDSVTWKRIVVLPFESRFVINSSFSPVRQIQTKTFQNKINLQIDKYKQAFMWLITQARSKSKAQKFSVDIIPDRMNQAKNIYQKELEAKFTSTD